MTVSPEAAVAGLRNPDQLRHATAQSVFGKNTARQIKLPLAQLLRLRLQEKPKYLA